jgi:hypothetical protein
LKGWRTFFETVASKDPRDKLRGIFKPTNMPPVRSRFAGAARKIVARTKVTYWVTLVFLVGYL